jgi:hypothetical protein
MNRLKLAVALICFALAGCGGPQLACNADGMIIIPDNAPLSIKTDWNGRNMKLAGDRLDKLTGSERARWLTNETLEKAKGCP